MISDDKSTSIPPLCKDCRWIKIGWLSRVLGMWENGYCKSPQRPLYPSSVDPVSGVVSAARRMSLCTSNRASDCGREGRFFELKNGSG